MVILTGEAAKDKIPIVYDDGITMVMYCGESNVREELDKVPPDGGLGPWTRGRDDKGRL